MGTFAGDFRCGDRITFMEESDEATLISVGISTGPYDKAGACRFVTDEYPTICTCTCDDDDDDEDKQPTEAPTSEPTMSPTISCKDSTGVVYKNNNNKKKCNWVKGNTTKKVRKKCKKIYKGVEVSDACPKACGKKGGVGKCSFLFKE